MVTKAACAAFGGLPNKYHGYKKLQIPSRVRLQLMSVRVYIDTGQCMIFTSVDSIFER